MSIDLPDYYFRIRENGAAVYRVTTDARDRRLEMNQIAVINIRRRDVKPHGDRQLSDADTRAIEAWMDQRQTVLATRELDDIHRAIECLNLTAQWAQSRATQAQLDDVTDTLLLAMHDLRSVLVRKKADRLKD